MSGWSKDLLLIAQTLAYFGLGCIVAGLFVAAFTQYGTGFNTAGFLTFCMGGVFLMVAVGLFIKVAINESRIQRWDDE